jgi:hypothetical protein
MQHKIITLTLTFVLLFSLQGFSQVTEKSKHPLLDKYYPRNTDTSKAVITQINPEPETKPATVPTITTTVVPAAPATPVITTTGAPAKPTAPVMPATSEPADVPTVISSATTPTVTAKPAMTTTTTTINKPTIVAPQIPTQKISSQPPPPPYRDTRLGSSTKQYDTWEKNNNGAGSVTTSPKG